MDQVAKQTSEYTCQPKWLLSGILVVLLFNLGCQPFNLNRTRLEPTPQVFEQPPSQTDLMTLVNQRSQAVKEVQAQVSVSLSGVPTRLNGSLVVQRPKNLRLKISPLGVDSLGADVGSNQEEFWVWIKSAGIGAESMMLHARHDEFANSPNANQLPLDPQWLFDSLGLVTFQPNRNYHGPTLRDGRLEVQETEYRPTGVQYSVLTFDQKTGLLLRKALYDSKGQLVGHCDLFDHQYHPSVGVALPTRVTINFHPNTPMASQAEIQLSNVQLNGLYVDQNSAWNRPTPVGVRQVDLARTVLAPSQMMIQTSGFQPPAEKPGEAGSFRGAFLNKLGLR